MKKGAVYWFVIVGIVLASSTAWATVYKVTDVLMPAYGYVVDMNSSGTVVGVFYSGEIEHSFTWSASKGFTNLDPLPGYDCASARAINGAGQIVGYSYVGHADYNRQNTLWNTTSSPSACSGTMLDIADSGTMVGRSADGWAVVCNGADQERICAKARANAISSNGAVVGMRDDGTSFLWTKTGGLRDIVVPSTHRPEAIAVNDAGQVLVQCGLQPTAVSSAIAAYLWEEGKGAVRIGSSTEAVFAMSMNAAGQVAGELYELSSMPMSSMPYVWDAANGVQVLPFDPTWRGAAACAMSDSGIIAGESIDAAGGSHLLLWTPITPEPSSLLALLAGVSGIGGLMVRRKTR